MGSFVSTNDVRVEKRATRPVDVIEAVDDEIDAINVNSSLRDIAGLPPNSDVVKTRMLCIGLDDGVICTARAKGETVAVRVGLYEGVVKTYMLWIGLNDGVICATRAKDETVTVRVGLYEGGVVIWPSLITAFDVSDGEYCVEYVVKVWIGVNEEVTCSLALTDEVVEARVDINEVGDVIWTFLDDPVDVSNDEYCVKGVTGVELRRWSGPVGQIKQIKSQAFFLLGKSVTFALLKSSKIERNKHAEQHENTTQFVQHQ